MDVTEINRQALNKYVRDLADVQLNHNPLSEEVIVIFNETIRDHHQDAVTKEVERVKKRAIVHKNLDMDYVQQGEFLTDDILGLSEDTDRLPWLISMTMTGLPRIPKLDDQLLFQGLLYTISACKPINRALTSMIWVYVYPDRTDTDILSIYNCLRLEDGALSIIYGGLPTQMSFNADAISDHSLREEFHSIVMPPKNQGTVYLFDKDSNACHFDYDIRI